MKNIFFLFIIILLAGSGGCKKFIDVNNDPNRPTDVSEKLLLGPIELSLAGEPGSVIANSFMQNLALNQPVPNIGTYQQVNTDFNAPWSTLYIECLQNLRILNQKAEANSNFNYSGISKILTAYSLGLLTSYYGDIPYSNSLKGVAVMNPSYDSQEDIYKTMQSLLDAGIADIDKNATLKPGKDDFYYAGDMSKWKRLAYTLKARYYMHLIKVSGSTAQADLALAALQNGMQSNADDMKWSYPGSSGYENRWYLEMGSVTTDIVASTLVNKLVATNDPRIGQLLAKSKTDGVYRGREIGYVGSLPLLGSFSVVGSFYGNTNSATYLVNYTEALFLKAEATLYKSGVAAAEPIYTDAVKAHMTKLSIPTTDVNNYLATRGTLTTENALRLIIEEKSIGNFLSVENYNDWRRTGYPAITLVPNASLPEIPRRFLYPQSELNTNPQAQHTATMTSRIWWDK